MPYDSNDPDRRRAPEGQTPESTEFVADMIRLGLRRARAAGHWPPKDTANRSVENRRPSTADDTTTEQR